jgi:hypothetical protein
VERERISGRALAAQGFRVLEHPAVGQKGVDFALQPAGGELLEDVPQVRPRVELVERQVAIIV